MSEEFTIGKVGPSRGKSVRLHLVGDDASERTVTVHKEFFRDDVKAAGLPFKDIQGTQQFTFGYAITCHKSQGSQWTNVCVFDESFAFREDSNRWLYTAVTRAADRLTLVLRDTPQAWENGNA